MLGPGLSTDLGERRLRRVGSGLLVVFLHDNVAQLGYLPWQLDLQNLRFTAFVCSLGLITARLLASVGAGIRVTKRLGVDFGAEPERALVFTITAWGRSSGSTRRNIGQSGSSSMIGKTHCSRP